MAKATTVKAAKPAELKEGTARYKLRRRYVDEVGLHPVGSILVFPIGKQPSSAKLVEEE